MWLSSPWDCWKSVQYCELTADHYCPAKFKGCTLSYRTKFASISIVFISLAKICHLLLFYSMEFAGIPLCPAISVFTLALFPGCCAGARLSLLLSCRTKCSIVFRWYFLVFCSRHLCPIGHNISIFYNVHFCPTGQGSVWVYGGVYWCEVWPVCRWVLEPGRRIVHQWVAVVSFPG